MIRRTKTLICFFRILPFIIAAGPGLEGASQADPGQDSYFNSGGNISSGEIIYLHIDRQKYIAGENLWFSIYLTDIKSGLLSDESSLAYVELLNPWNVPLIRERIKLQDGRGEGVLIIPDSCSSGNYSVRAYTNWMKNFLPLWCYIQDIDVFNPFRNTDIWYKTDTAVVNVNRTILESENNVIIVKADSIYSRREKVIIGIEISDNIKKAMPSSDLSIAVALSEASSCNKWPSYQDNPEIPEIKVPYPYQFEHEGHFLSGKIRYREPEQSASPGFLYMSVKGKVADFRYAQVDTTGRFSFLLPIDSKLRTLILQPQQVNSNMILEIEPSFSLYLSPPRCLRTMIGDSLQDIFPELSFNYQANKIYGITFTKDVDADDSINQKKRRFYGIPEMEVILNDFIKLPSMEEVFIELLPGVILRSRKTGYEIRITNPLTGEFYAEPPLVMIDGVIINDLQTLVDLDPEKVEKIEVTKTPYVVGDLVLHGIINVITISGDFSSIEMPEYAVILPYRVAEEPSFFIAPEYSGKEEKLSRRPDLRNTLYWNPSVRTGTDGRINIEFWTSDLPGKYTVNIMGISTGGEKLFKRHSFTVR